MLSKYPQGHGFTAANKQNKERKVITAHTERLIALLFNNAHSIFMLLVKISIFHLKEYTRSNSGLCLDKLRRLPSSDKRKMYVYI